MIVAIDRVPSEPTARAAAASATGLALADLNRRLAGTLPRILLPGAGDDQALSVAAALEGLGFGVFTFDASVVPNDQQRIVARRIEMTGDALIAFDAQQNEHSCPGRNIALVQRGNRTTSTSETVKSTDRQLSIGRAVMSGGLVLSKKVEKTTVKNTETTEAFLLVERDDDQPDIMLYERRIDYRFLGAAMQPASRANLEQVWTRLGAMAGGGRTDDRLTRPGFVQGLPMTSAEPVDLALFLVSLSRRA